MPAKSKSQQRLMGLAYAYKSGEIKAKDLNPKYADKVKDLAKSMTQKQLKDFAKTKHKKLPEKVEETLLKFGEFNKLFENDLTKIDQVDKLYQDIFDFISNRGLSIIDKSDFEYNIKRVLYKQLNWE